MTDMPEIPAEFQVEWDPADAELQWEWDDMHWPAPLSPLAGDYAHLIFAGIDASYPYFGAPFRLFGRIVAGYGYLAMRYGVPDDEVAATFDALRQRQREFIPDNARYWRDEALPALRDTYAFLEGIDVDGLPAAELADAWHMAWARIEDAWRIHFIAIRGAYMVAEDLSDLYEQLFPGVPPGEAMALIQGGNDVLQEVESDIEALVDLIAATPAAANRLRESPPPSLDDLTADAPAVGAAIRDFLDRHGHLGQTFDDFSLPSWADDPTILVTELAKRLADPPERHADRLGRLRAEAAKLRATAAERLADRPEDAAEFERLLGQASEIGPLTEIHNYWIDRMAQARLRGLSMRVGRRLAREGTIADHADVLYLTRAEVAELLHTPADMSAVVATRRADHAHQRTLKPPAKLGRPEPDFGITSRFDVAREDAAASDELKGVGASAGVVRGTARVALGTEDFPRIERGDIIVCPSSNPSWVPVFAIAGGLVTNTGGVLAHAAVVAREFGLPAVVGVTGATTLIPDGRTVEIDGTAGTVRLL